MKQFRPTLLCLLLMFSVTGIPAQTNTSDQTLVQHIRNLRDRWIEAEEKKDIPYLQSLIANDCVIGNSQGQVLNKTRFLERIGSPDRTLKISNTRDLEIRLFGNVAILTENITVQGKDHGKPFGGDFRFIRIFAEDGKKWRVVLGQGTPIAATSQPGAPDHNRPALRRSPQ